MSEEGQWQNEGQQTEGHHDDDDEDDSKLLMDETAWQTPGAGVTPGGDNDNDNECENGPNASNVDLCILCDITDSMKAWIKQVRHGIRHIVNELRSTFGIGQLRLAFVGYRDWDDDDNNSGHPRLQTLQFTDDISAFEAFVIKCAPVGGGDAAEDVLGGIQQSVFGIAWQAPIRVLYHICDAPAHGVMYHDLYDQIEQLTTKGDNKRTKATFRFLDGILSDDDDSDDDDSDSDKEESKSTEVIAMKGDDDDSKLAVETPTEVQLVRDEFDKWPDKHPNDPRHEDLFLAMQKHRIQYFIGTHTQYTDKMVTVFSSYCKSIDYELKIMDLMNTAQFLPTLIQAVSTAVRVVFRRNLPDIRLNLNELHKLRQRKLHQFKVHCGVDFGTAGSGFAYALHGKNEVYVDQNWNDNGKHVDVKTKTNILLRKDNGACVAFGDDATDQYVRTDCNHLFFERFKMALYDRDDDDDGAADGDGDKKGKSGDHRIDIKETLEAANGERMASRKVLEEAIRFMTNHCLNNLRRKLGDSLDKKDIQWILTVPAIWSDRAKSIMQNAAIAAGMIDGDMDDQLVIAYEPECASLSIQHEMNERLRLQQQQQQQASSSNDDKAASLSSSFFEVGDKVMLCDLGGGTADIACHQMDECGGMKQISSPSGGPWGSTYIDDAFLRLLTEVVSAEWMREFQLQHASQYIELLQNFRASKAKYFVDVKSKKKKIKKTDFDCTFYNVKLPFEFVDFMEGKLSEEAEDNDDDDDDDDSMLLEKKVRQFDFVFKNNQKSGAQLLRLNEQTLELSYSVWNSLFDGVIDEIMAHIADLLATETMSGCKYLCLCGGFSQSAYLQHRLFKKFGTRSQYDLCIFTPRRPILSVVDGAVRMGLRPNFISARTIGKTYGIAVQKDLDEWKRIYPDVLIPKNKVGKRVIATQNDGDKTAAKMLRAKPVINDVFLPFVRRNTLIKNGDQPIVYWLEPADCQSHKINIRLYDSLEIDPKFVQHNRLNANIEIELSPQWRQRNEPLPVIFIFNDTTIRVFVESVDDQNQLNIKEVAINFETV